MINILMLALALSKPLDYGLVEPEPTPLYEGTATWYDYKLGGEWRSKNHSTCALRIKERYNTYKVCLKNTDRCIECYHNDYGPTREDRVIDLSSYAFKQLGLSLSRGVAEVNVYLVE